MQSGDLADGTLGDVLRSLAADSATGGLHVRRTREGASQRDAVLYLKDGALYAATSPGPRPLLGVRLVAAGAVTREALQEALESQAGDLAGWRLGELLVHLGYVDAEIVTEFVIEQMLDAIGEVVSWPDGTWRFRKGEHTRGSEDFALDVGAVLAHVAKRLHHLTTLAAAGSADSVPVRLSYDSDLASAQIPLAQTLLSVIDGNRSISELAVRCGLTTFEAGQVLSLLVESGAVELREPPSVEAAEAPAGTVATPEDTAVADDDLSALLAAGDDDLGMQLAVLARQAEEARFAAEDRRREEITSRRREARETAEAAAAEPQAEVTTVPEPSPVTEEIPIRPEDFPAPEDLPLAYDHLDALAAAVAEATLLADETPEAPAGPTPFAAEAPEDVDLRAAHGTFEPAADHPGDDSGVAALRELASADFTTNDPDEDVRAPSREPLPAAVPGGSYQPAFASDDNGSNPFVDSAALLRELSSLGLDDMPAPSAARAPIQRAPVATQTRPRRKSIFGR
ncbi:MAG: DUF4388 domain-containing protein [Mycobacteriales bacterium]